MLWKMQLLEKTMAVNLIRFQICRPKLVPQSPSKKELSRPSGGVSVLHREIRMIHGSSKGSNQATKGEKPWNSKGFFTNIRVFPLKRSWFWSRDPLHHNQLQENDDFCNWSFDFTRDTRALLGIYFIHNSNKNDSFNALRWTWKSGIIKRRKNRKTNPFLSVAPTTWLPILGEPPCISVSKGIT